MMSNKMFSVLALVAPLAIGAFAVSPVTPMSEASATVALPNLCEATRGVCEYTSINTAPALNATVCYNGTTVTLMPATGCAKQAYYLSYGIVADPITNIVLPLSPLKDACDVGYCVVVDQIDPGTIVTDTPICCNPQTGECTPSEDLVCDFGIVWCENLVEDGDGFKCLDEE